MWTQESNSTENVGFYIKNTVKKTKEKAELSIANLKNHHTLKVSNVSDVGLPTYNGALKYVKTIQKLEFKILMCILMPIYGKSIAPWVPAYPLLTGMIRQKPMAQLDVFVRGIPIFGTNPEMVLWLPIVSITYRPNCNWWYISFWIVKPYRSYIKFLWYQCDHFGIISNHRLTVWHRLQQRKLISKNKIHKKKQSKTESPKSNTTGRITRKKSKQKHETQKKNNTNINQNMDFPQCFFLYFLYSFFASLVCFFCLLWIWFFFVLLFKLCKTLHSLCRWTYNTLI